MKIYIIIVATICCLFPSSLFGQFKLMPKKNNPVLLMSRESKTVTLMSNRKIILYKTVGSKVKGRLKEFRNDSIFLMENAIAINEIEKIAFFPYSSRISGHTINAVGGFIGGIGLYGISYTLINNKLGSSDKYALMLAAITVGFSLPILASGYLLTKVKRKFNTKGNKTWTLMHPIEKETKL